MDNVPGRDDDRVGRTVERVGVDGGGGSFHDVRSGMALRGSGRGPDCPGLRSVVWRDATRRRANVGDGRVSRVQTVAAARILTEGRGEDGADSG